MKKKILWFLIYGLIFIVWFILGILTPFVIGGKDMFNFILLDFRGNNSSLIVYKVILVLFAGYSTYSTYLIVNPRKIKDAIPIILLIGIPALTLCYGFWNMQYGLMEVADAIANAPAAQRLQQMVAGISICSNYGLVGFSYSIGQIIICIIVLIYGNQSKFKNGGHTTRQ
jgi:hypothetical protein